MAAPVAHKARRPAHTLHAQSKHFLLPLNNSRPLLQPPALLLLFVLSPPFAPETTLVVADSAPSPHAPPIAANMAGVALAAMAHEEKDPILPQAAKFSLLSLPGAGLR